MGIPLISRSNGDNNYFPCNNGAQQTQPNPKRYKILQRTTIRDHLILYISYPDSTNYEGKKILVFDKGITVDDLKKQGEIDPHFAENPDYISPIARFVPTNEGWRMAMRFILNYK